MNTKKSTGKSGKVRKRIFAGFLIFIAVLLLAFFILKTIKSRSGLPDYAEDIVLDNLKETVEVYRDEVGTPHIFAKNEEDLYRSVGYLMAQDRMWQMDLLRRVTQGRLSEIFGDDFVEDDLLLRSLEYTAKSKEILDKSSEKIKSVLNAFCDGVNQYIVQYDNNYPLEFLLLGYKPEKWLPEHSLNLIGYMAWDLKAGWNELILEDLRQKLDSVHFVELLPDLSLYKECVFESENTKELLSGNKLRGLEKLNSLGLDVLSGSNNWAVSGKKSETGMPIVANDMHLALNVPGIWMQMHQVVEGKLNVSGLVLPGQPLVIVGHNDSIAWGMTNTYVDNLDYYEEKINPENQDQYEYMGKWYDFTVVNEKIKSSSDTVFIRKYRKSRRGPVVSEIKKIKDRVLTIHWVGAEESNEFLSIYKVNRAGNWDEFKNAFTTFRSISQNVVYADVKGNIGLYACAGVPIRKRSAVFQVLPGWTDEYDWQGLVPFDELPHEFNPERGYVSSANNKTTDSTYPYHIGTWYSLPYRIERIRTMLNADDKLSVSDFIHIQNDTKSTFSLRLVEDVFPYISDSLEDNIAFEISQLLKSWDGNMDKNLIEPTVSEAFVWKLTRLIFEDEIGQELFEKFEKNGKLPRIAMYNLLKHSDSPWIDNVNTEPVENFKQIVNKAFEETISYLVENYSSDIRKWKWKYIHTLTIKHPLTLGVEALDVVFNFNRGPFGVSGAKHTVSPYSYPMFEPYNVNHGSSHRHIFNLINWDSTLSVIPTGNSGVVSSEFYCDQTKLYIEGKYHSDFFSRSTIEKNFKYRIQIKPKEK